MPTGTIVYCSGLLQLADEKKKHCVPKSMYEWHANKPAFREFLQLIALVFAMEHVLPARCLASALALA